MSNKYGVYLWQYKGSAPFIAKECVCQSARVLFAQIKVTLPKALFTLMYTFDEHLWHTF